MIVITTTGLVIVAVLIGVTILTGGMTMAAISVMVSDIIIKGIQTKSDNCEIVSVGNFGTFEGSEMRPLMSPDH